MNNDQINNRATKLKNLPIGISTLENIRKNDYLYIDKTHHLARMMATGGRYFFLSRPRRFGKSLFIDTIKQAFLGRKDLFIGLTLENTWDWSKQYPVIHFDFGRGSASNREITFLEIVNDTLYNMAEQYDITLNHSHYAGRFNELLYKIYNKTKSQVVVLIDEYDKPILDVINDSQMALSMREQLKDLYSVIKSNDQYLEFVMLTGVSKFSKVSLFSGLNNLEDITIDPNYADICGYTQSELEHGFAQYLMDGKVDQKKLKLWYNGYNFGGNEKQKVYNPFDILLFCSKNYVYRNYWFETATPTFLVKLIEQNHHYIPAIDNTLILDSDLSSFDVNNIHVIVLLLQTGYLTIKEQTTMGSQCAYILTYPNLEVKASINSSLIMIGTTQENRNRNLFAFNQCLYDNNFTQLQTIFTSHFAGIPNNWYTNNDIANYEGFYASIVYSYFAALGYNLIAEDVTNHGRIDLTMIMPDKVIIIEFKLAKYGSAAEAIAQIKSKNYAEKYRAEKLPIHLVAIVFDSEQRNVSEVMHNTLEQ